MKQISKKRVKAPTKASYVKVCDLKPIVLACVVVSSAAA